MNGIDKLFHLKYLSLRDTKMSKLPSGILKLYGLETLDISNTFIEELPSEIVRLIKIQHLLAHHGFNGASGAMKIPNGIGNMRNLRVISGFNVINSSLSAVEELAYLKFEEGAMPKLEKLEVPFFVSVAKANGFDLGIINLPCLKHAKIRLDNTDATSSESKTAAAAIRNEANAHPSHPRVLVYGEMEQDVEENDIDKEASCTNEEER
nr:unnamed protein product [Digitaria exilis]